MSSEEKKEPEERSKFNETLDKLKKNKNLEGAIEYAQSHKSDTIAYALLGVGILWLLFQPFYGGLLIGLVAGFYFSKSLSHFARHLPNCVEQYGLSKCVVMGVTFLALLLLAPGILIGAALSVAAVEFFLVTKKN